MNHQTQTATAQIIDMPSTETHQIQSMQATDVMMNDASMNRLMKMAEVMATSKVTVPKHLQGSAGDCFAVVLQAAQWGMNPFSVAQKTHLVNGTLGYEAQLVNAVITTRAPITGRLQFEFFGDWSKVNGKEDKSAERGVRVWATFKGEEEPRVLEIGMHQVGPVRNSPMWIADPRQQLAYLAVKRWSRLYCPDVILGVYTPDEIVEEERDITPPAAEKPKAHAGSAALKDRLATARKKADPLEGNAVEFDVDALIERINVANTAADLKAIAKEAPRDLGEPAKSILKSVYESRLELIKQHEAEQQAQAEAVPYMPRQSIDATIKEFERVISTHDLETLWKTRVIERRGQISDADYSDLEMAYSAQMDALNA